MGWFLGLDTSNYTTSTALYCDDTGEMLMQKQLLPVKDNSRGLRQSDAVFLHIKQLGGLIHQLMESKKITLNAIGVSGYPRTVAGSYMPCFLVGEMLAESLASVLRIPKYVFSHQQGHLAAALYSANLPDWFERDFYAFHVSGGTTEALEVHCSGAEMEIEILAKTLDLNAGQIIDRVGIMLGLSFPCGKELEKLASACQQKITAKPTLKGADCCLSGVENQCRKLYDEGYSREWIAAYCLEVVKKTIDAMTEALIAIHGKKPVIYAGGVMSNSLIRSYLEQKYDGKFAEPCFSTDNSGGIALLAAIKYKEHGVIGAGIDGFSAERLSENVD